MTRVFVPKKVFFTCGVGRDSEYLGSFEMALRAAKIECYNLVTVSSILPPKCRIIQRDEGIADLDPGSIVFTVMSRISSNEPHRRISASIGVAIPENMEKEWGYFAEHHAFGDGKEKAGRYAEELAYRMYQSITDKTPRKTLNITDSAIVDEDGRWTTVIAASIFIME
ncbi:pyruvoyl-dependent arginine decarboxylase [Methanofollis fontis]|uniref:pyruvoyl-dependent arginine decarboxylase n=1 Tax=Methanofollis fontis TaxID=2052832 RepID=UPI001F39B485|nr:arginine decarboxylase, pyruvoyl-dependent [Methanofollis fontis]